MEVDWAAEFSDITKCRRCSSGVINDDQANPPQPGFVGTNYAAYGVVLIGQNPGWPKPADHERDLQYTRQLQRLANDRAKDQYTDVQQELAAFIPDWVIGQYFPLNIAGLTIHDIAYFNAVRCRTFENVNPSSRVYTNCLGHACRWLDLLKPKKVVFLGKAAANVLGSACEKRGLATFTINRDRALNLQQRRQIINDAASFILGEASDVQAYLQNAQQLKSECLSVEYEEGITPGDAIRVLTGLQTRGLTDSVFHKVHHFTELGRPESINGFLSYCQKKRSFQKNGTNQRVVRRLLYILDRAPVSGTLTEDQWLKLANLALEAIPLTRDVLTS